MTLKNKFESEAYAIHSGDIGSLKTANIESLNAVTPFKKRIFPVNNKPRLTYFIRKEIMTRSRLKNKANEIGKEEDLNAYKKQRILVVKLKKKAKRNFLKSCVSTNDKIKNNFWKFCEPFLTEKCSQYNQNITLIEKNAQYRKITKLQIFSTNIHKDTEHTRMETTKRNYLPKSRY